MFRPLIEGKEYITKRDSEAEGIELRLLNASNAYFSKFLREIKSNLSKASKTYKIMKKDINLEMIDIILPSQEEKTNEFILIITPILLAGYKASYDSMNMGTFSQKNAQIQKSLNIEKALFGGMMGKIFLNLRESLKNAIGANLTLKEMNELVSKLVNFNSVTAKKIARTESLRTANVGMFAATYDNNDIQAYKWVTVMDNATRHSHAEVDGEIVDKGAYFSNGLQYPLDPNGPPEEVCNCRCVAIPLQKR